MADLFFREVKRMHQLRQDINEMTPEEVDELIRGLGDGLAFQLGVYLPITASASIALLQPVKGAVVELQWALRMHGFGAHPPDELQA